MSKLFLFARFCLMPLTPIFAQKGEIKNDSIPTAYAPDSSIWGKISENDLKMTVYAPDSSADAVVLSAKGEICLDILKPEKGLQMKFRVYRCVKIFNKSAFESEGNLSIDNYSNGYVGEISNLKASIIQTDGAQQDFLQKDFFEEKMPSGISVFKLAFPNLQEGSIVRYTYEMTSQNIETLENWIFQENIPVRHSEINLKFSNDYQYIYLFRGTKGIKSECHKVKSWNDKSYYMSNTRFWADSLPALKSEAYITTMNDYLMQIRFQLSKIRQDYGRTEDYLTTWPKLTKLIIDDAHIGKQFTKKGNYSNVWKVINPLLEAAKTDNEKIDIVYKYLCENLTWDAEHYSIYSETTLNEAFRKKKARSSVKQQKRDYPIDFAYPIREQFILNLTFPEGYVLEDMPKDLTISLLKNSGSFQYSATQKNNSLQLIVKIQIGQLHFEPEGYALVKEFFNQIAVKLGEQIVLKKKN